MKTAYEHIKSNNIKTAILIVLFPMIFIALVFFGVWIVAPMTTAIDTTVTVAIPTFIACAAWMAISWAFGDSMMLSMARASEIHDDQPEYRDVFHSVQNIALAAGLPTPRVYIINDESLNAFATGRNPHSASIALTSGIIKKLTRLELEGVIAHEMAHIGNRDIRTDMLLITGVGVTVFAADLILRMAMTGGNRDDKNNSAAIFLMVWLAFMVFNLLIVPLLRMAVSRSHEYNADAVGATITRNPRALANALRKISGDAHIESIDRAASMASVFIENPTGKKFIGELFATHPPVEERIKRLEGMQNG